MRNCQRFKVIFIRHLTLLAYFKDTRERLKFMFSVASYLREK